MPKITNEFKTGLMLILVFAIILYFVYSTGGLRLSKEGYELTVLYGFVSGLRENASVKLCGADVGSVKSVEILCDEEVTQVAVTLWIDSDIKIREDSKFYISTVGLMGENYIEITAGSRGAAFLEADNVLTGEDPFKMEILMGKADIMADNINATLLEIKKLSESANDLVSKKEIDNTLKNLEITSENFKEFSEDLKRHPWKLIWKTKEKKDAPEDSPKKYNLDEKKRGIDFEEGVIQ